MESDLASPLGRDGLKNALWALGWSQAEFAERIGVHENTVSKWMVGKTRIPTPVDAYINLVLGLKIQTDTLSPHRKRSAYRARKKEQK